MRIRATAQQVGLSAEERDRNVRGAFRVTAEGRRAIAGRRVLLVDDVYTTGATVKAGTRALLRAGAAGRRRAHLRPGCQRHDLIDI